MHRWHKGVGSDSLNVSRVGQRATTHTHTQWQLQALCGKQSTATGWLASLPLSPQEPKTLKPEFDDGVSSVFLVCIYFEETDGHHHVTPRHRVVAPFCGAGSFGGTMFFFMLGHSYEMNGIQHEHRSICERGMVRDDSKLLHGGGEISKSQGRG